MKIRSIALDDNEEPSTVTVEMTTREAALIQGILSHCSQADVSTVLGGDTTWWVEQHAIYDALSGGFFNRFWDDGVRDVLRVPRLYLSTTNPEPTQ